MIVAKLLRVKNTFTTAVGDVIVDLISSTFTFDNYTSQGAGLARVGPDEVMRPDLIAVRMYSDQNYYDLLLKYNGISNPLSLDANELLIIPPVKDMERMLISPKIVAEKGTQKTATAEDILLNPKTDKDKKRLEALKDKVKEIVPPNVNTTGNKNIKVKDGRVIFGEDVTQINKDNCPIPISRARLIQQLTKSNLF